MFPIHLQKTEEESKELEEFYQSFGLEDPDHTGKIQSPSSDLEKTIQVMINEKKEQDLVIEEMKKEIQLLKDQSSVETPSSSGSKKVVVNKTVKEFTEEPPMIEVSKTVIDSMEEEFKKEFGFYDLDQDKIKKDRKKKKKVIEEVITEPKKPFVRTVVKKDPVVKKETADPVVIEETEFMKNFRLQVEKDKIESRKKTGLNINFYRTSEDIPIDKKIEMAMASL